MAERKYKWHESVTLGVLYFLVGVMITFNGFTKLTSHFVQNGHIKGGSTKAKGVIAIISLIENGWWKYLIIAVFFYLAYDFIGKGIKTFRS